MKIIKNILKVLLVMAVLCCAGLGDNPAHATGTADAAEPAVVEVAP